MSEKKAAPFSHPRWKDIPKPEVIGHCEVSEEEKNDPEFLAFIEREMERRKKLEHEELKTLCGRKGITRKTCSPFYIQIFRRTTKWQKKKQ